MRDCGVRLKVNNHRLKPVVSDDMRERNVRLKLNDHRLKPVLSALQILVQFSEVIPHGRESH